MWETVRLGDVCELAYGKALPNSERLEAGEFPAFGANGIKTYAKRPLFSGPSIIIGRKGSAGQITKVAQPFWPLDVTYYTKIDASRILLEFLYYTLSVLDLPSMARGVKPGINRNDLYSINISLPPLAEQKRIVERLDKAFAEIDKAINLSKHQEEMLLKLAFSALASFYDCTDKDLIKPLRAIASINGGKRLPKGKSLVKENTGYPYIRVSDFNNDGTINLHLVQFIEPDVQRSISKYTISSKDIYISIAGTIGKTGVVPESLDGANLTENAAKLALYEDVERDFVYFFTKTFCFQQQAILQTRKTAQPKLSLERLGAVRIPIFGLDKQHEIISRARGVMGLVEQAKDNRRCKEAKFIALKAAILRQELTPSEAV